MPKFSANLQYAAATLGRAGIQLRVEPLNDRDIPGFLLNTTRDAIDLFDAVGHPNLALQCDIYHTPCGLSVLVATAQGQAVITGFCVIDENFHPPKAVRAMEMEVIPPGTPTDPYRAYDIMLEVKSRADLLIPLHPPRFAALDTVAC